MQVFWYRNYGKTLIATDLQGQQIGEKLAPIIGPIHPVYSTFDIQLFRFFVKIKGAGAKDTEWIGPMNGAREKHDIHGTFLQVYIFPSLTSIHP